MIFPNLHIFLLFVIFIINPPISDDGDFVCCHIISEMQHALETRLPYYKQSYEYLLNSRDLMVMMKAVPFKVECYNKISPLLHPYFHNTNTFNASFKLQFNFTHNLDELQLFWMCSSIPYVCQPRRIKNSVKHPRWILFAKIVS